ncbi:MAG: AraC family transcriptional regulator [Kiritimatiellae bacterium]|nr:AraC family transcriptional regulator [Kiritimatiellia bacterium]
MGELRPNYDGVHVAWDHRGVRTRHVSFGQVRYQPGGYCGPRVQRDYQLVMLHSGACEVRVDGSARRLLPGLVYLFTPGHRELFRFARDGETHHSWCSVAPSLVGGVLRRELAGGAEGVAVSDALEKIFAAAFSLPPPAHAAARAVVEALGRAALAEFARLRREASAALGRDPCVQRALRHMEGHLADRECLEGARRAACCSPNALLYKFRAATGLTPARYLWRLRTERGAAMLTETGLSVAEIADRCGFANPFHFSRCVRRLFAMSPRQLRRRAWR